VGSLQIDSTPRGARVFVDRQSVGVTPLVLPGLVVGSHVVRLEADGHKPWSSAIRITADRQTDLRTTLAPSVEDESPRP
jgi:PEGA domain